jgi:hypothetical protein
MGVSVDFRTVPKSSTTIKETLQAGCAESAGKEGAFELKDIAKAAVSMYAAAGGTGVKGARMWVALESQWMLPVIRYCGYCS